MLSLVATECVMVPSTLICLCSAGMRSGIVGAPGDAWCMVSRQGEMTHRHLLWTHESWSRAQGTAESAGKLAQSHSIGGTVVLHILRASSVTPRSQSSPGPYEPGVGIPVRSRAKLKLVQPSNCKSAHDMLDMATARLHPQLYAC